MHEEFREVVRQALTFAAAARSGEQQELVRSFSDFEVYDCPFPEDGAISTNAPVCLAARISGAEKPGPSLLAQELAALINSRSSDLFTAAAGGPGFLNAFPAGSFINEFLHLLAESQGKKLFSRLPVRMEHEVSVPEFHVDWQSKGLQRRMSEEAELFLDARGNSVLLRADQLMLLALCADHELEAAPYQKGLFGRQNVPWYFGRFLEDSALYLGQLPAGGSAEFTAEDWKEPLVHNILVFRQRFHEALAFKRPDVFMAHLLKCVRDFYAFYNRPENRALTASAARVSLLVSLTSGLVKTGLEALKVQPFSGLPRRA